MKSRKSLRRTFAVTAILFLTALGCGCQQTIPTHVVQTPHPTSPVQTNAAFFADSVSVGLTKPPYNYHSGDFTLTSETATVTVACYGADQTNFQSAPYTITVDVYYSGQILQVAVASATCKQGNPSLSIGEFTVPALHDHRFYLLMHAGGPWTVEVDPA